MTNLGLNIGTRSGGPSVLPCGYVNVALLEIGNLYSNISCPYIFVFVLIADISLKMLHK